MAAALRMLAAGGAWVLVAAVMFAGCSSSGGSSGRASSEPLLVDVYTMTHDSGGRVVVEMVWPARFGKEIQVVEVKDLDLTAAEITLVPGGRWATNFQVTIPTLANKPLVSVKSWEPRLDADFPVAPDAGEDSRSELIFHSPSRADARRAVHLLGQWQGKPHR